jgi:phosphate:Na+ symporter
VDTISAGVGIAPDNCTLKLTVFHTVFNTIGVVVMLPFTQRLADRLTLLMPGVERYRTEPRYLNKVALVVPAAAIEAVRKETIHLYDHAFAIIAHAIGLEGLAILFDEKLEVVVWRSGPVAPYDVDIDYETTAKTLHSAIVDFISRAQLAAVPKQAEELFALRLASRDVVEGIKAAKHLHKNLSRYSHSDSEVLRQEYDGIRTRLASVLRRLHHVRMGEQRLEEVLTLPQVKRETRDADVALQVRIEGLLRDRNLKLEEARSVMHDSV